MHELSQLDIARSRVLVTGGAGFIGTHCCVALLEKGVDVVVLDSLINSELNAMRRVEEISQSKIRFVEGDVRNTLLVKKIIAEHNVDSVIHFAALKSVSESIKCPLEYYDNNVVGLISLLQAMEETNLRKIVFSSSATVYGVPNRVPITEDFPTAAINPYGYSKLMAEQLLKDVAKSGEWSIGVLRYFNPVGAHPTGRIGENPKGEPTNLMPIITQVAAGNREKLLIYGGDYPTFDGTGVRDFIHVVDLADAHVAALSHLSAKKGIRILNIGTGRGVSVLELISTFKEVTGVEVPFEIVARRPGDVAECWADASLSNQVLGWKAERSIEAMCEDAWRWKRDNPLGFAN